MRLSKKQREFVRLKFGGMCAYCGCELPDKGWHADHVDPCFRKMEVVPRDERKNPQAFEVRHSGEFFNEEANKIENFYPACAPCNLFKSTFSLDMFRSEISKQTERAALYSVNFRTALRFRQVELNNNPVVFWFEKYSNSHGQGGVKSD